MNIIAHCDICGIDLSSAYSRHQKSKAHQDKMSSKEYSALLVQVKNSQANKRNDEHIVGAIEDNPQLIKLLQEDESTHEPRKSTLAHLTGLAHQLQTDAKFVKNRNSLKEFSESKTYQDDPLIRPIFKAIVKAEHLTDAAEAASAIRTFRDAAKILTFAADIEEQRRTFLPDLVAAEWIISKFPESSYKRQKIDGEIAAAAYDQSQSKVDE
jgi:hypothetical protein